jgi:hypothetical protein
MEESLKKLFCALALSCALPLLSALDVVTLSSSPRDEGAAGSRLTVSMNREADIFIIDLPGDDETVNLSVFVDTESIRVGALETMLGLLKKSARVSDITVTDATSSMKALTGKNVSFKCTYPDSGTMYSYIANRILSPEKGDKLDNEYFGLRFSILDKSYSTIWKIGDTSWATMMLPLEMTLNKSWNALMRKDPESGLIVSERNASPSGKRALVAVSGNMAIVTLITSGASENVRLRLQFPEWIQAAYSCNRVADSLYLNIDPEATGGSLCFLYGTPLKSCEYYTTYSKEIDKPGRSGTIDVLGSAALALTGKKKGYKTATTRVPSPKAGDTVKLAINEFPYSPLNPDILRFGPAKGRENPKPFSPTQLSLGAGIAVSDAGDLSSISPDNLYAQIKGYGRVVAESKLPICFSLLAGKMPVTGQTEDGYALSGNPVLVESSFGLMLPLYIGPFQLEVGGSVGVFMFSSMDYFDASQNREQETAGIYGVSPSLLAGLSLVPIGNLGINVDCQYKLFFDAENNKFDPAFLVSVNGTFIKSR